MVELNCGRPIVSVIWCFEDFSIRFHFKYKRYLHLVASEFELISAKSRWHVCVCLCFN